MCFRPTGGVSGIHMSGDYFQLGGGIRLKLSRMIGGLGIPLCIKTCVCICLGVCMGDMSEGYKCLGTILLEVPCFY